MMNKALILLAMLAAAAACEACGEPLAAQREEAILDLEVRSEDLPRMFFDITVRHGVPGDAGRPAAAASPQIDGSMGRSRQATTSNPVREAAS